MLCSFNYEERKKKEEKCRFVHCNLFAGINVVLEFTGTPKNNNISFGDA